MSDAPAVRIVVVSHSARLAAGVVELAAQMAPDVDLAAAGGGDDGGLGTSFDRISAALAEPPAGGIVVLYDLGSALLTTETALEFLDDDLAAGITVVDAPLVEGTLAAAVAAQGGAARDDVGAAARSSGAGDGAAPAPTEPGADDAVSGTATLPNPLGLHARPAAELAAALAGFDARVSVTGGDGPAVDVRRVLDVVRLALRGGAQVGVSATGPQAGPALDRALELLAGGFGETDDAPSRARTDGDGPMPGAPGRAVGPLVHAGVVRLPDTDPADTDPADTDPAEADPAAADDPAEEQHRLDDAVAAAAARLRSGDAMSRLHAAIVTDDELRTAAARAVADGRSATRAWWDAVSASAETLAGAADEVVAGRAVDVREAGVAVLRELGVAAGRLPSDVGGRVLAADELGPGELAEFAAGGGAGVVLAAGSPTAHAVIVARGLGVPLVLRAGARLDRVADGTVVALDGDTGTVEVDPPDADERIRAIAADGAARAELRAAAAAPVVVDGRPILVGANVGSLAEARAAVDNGADGVGLLRTELLALDRDTLPGEDEQAADLAAILDVVGGRPVTVRVLDAGGDKPVRALRLDPRRNGFLGVRGLRWLLTEPEVLRRQLRAILRAGQGHRVSVMAPMVSLAWEARAFRQAVDDTVASLVADGVPHAAPEAVGVMIEVPAAALAADEIADGLDFVSLGTNDLLSYTMAADRTEPGVADLLDPGATALWRLVEQVGERVRGRAALAVCGELAAVPDFAARLVGLGVTELSMAPAAIPAVKQHLRTL